MTDFTQSASLRTPPPIREGLMQLDPLRLLGSRCGDCGNVMFPTRDFCSKCLRDLSEPSIALDPRGVVYSYTVIRQAPPGRETPYVLAYVDLNDGVRVMAQIRIEPEQAVIGAPVTLERSEVRMPSGELRLSYVFVPDTVREGETT